jgi:hypothetical protein
MIFFWQALYGCTEVKLRYKLAPLCTIRQYKSPGPYCTMPALYRVGPVGPDARGFALYWGCTIDYPGLVALAVLAVLEEVRSILTCWFMPWKTLPIMSSRCCSWTGVKSAISRVPPGTSSWLSEGSGCGKWLRSDLWISSATSEVLWRDGCSRCSSRARSGWRSGRAIRRPRLRAGPGLQIAQAVYQRLSGFLTWVLFLEASPMLWEAETSWRLEILILSITEVGIIWNFLTELFRDDLSSAQSNETDGSR